MEVCERTLKDFQLGALVDWLEELHERDKGKYFGHEPVFYRVHDLMPHFCRNIHSTL